MSNKTAGVTGHNSSVSYQNDRFSDLSVDIIFHAPNDEIDDFKKQIVSDISKLCESYWKKEPFVPPGEYESTVLVEKTNEAIKKADEAMKVRYAKQNQNIE
ncbi:hypothetical protein BK128_09665 [Viridibacillus sp. FSL H7-0596]|uniref:hypothetical protein n=1 Tax=Viridibacillus sp. FSL H7-0596 TaxID=1928923 RepID=UPI0009701F1F|nr:hypothetical protein [Viridibacillus sp. FSL H7-0596]OMC86922.1 hypothetical protein BK128_09665 [Viridibacillus sp. FSL H7-0596]